MGFLCSEGDCDHGLTPWSQKGRDHGVGLDPETVNCKVFCFEINGCKLPSRVFLIVLFLGGGPLAVHRARRGLLICR